METARLKHGDDARSPNRRGGKVPFFRPVIKPKLSINEPGDHYEREADAMADKVMRLTDASAIHNAFFKPAANTIQRKCQACEEDDKHVHRKENDGKETTGSNGLDNYVNTLSSSGQPMPESSRKFFEPKFGHDFSKVKLHTDSVAAKSAQSINALAYTTGNNIVFNSGQYSPESDSGKKLMAHELTHVVQQKESPQTIRRKITIGNTVMNIDDKYRKTVKDTFGETGLKIVLAWNNNGADPEYKFKDWEAYRKEISVRSSSIKGMDLVNDQSTNCCNYPTADHPGGILDPIYWDKMGDYDFRAKSPLPAGKNASDAIEAIFKPNAGTELECLTMSIAIGYYELLQGLGKAKFDKMFPLGAGLVIGKSGNDLLNSVINTPKYEELKDKQKITALIPGDRGYFKNFSDYGDKHPSGLWQGENVIYYGDGKFSGFGIGIYDEDTILQKLVDHYNEGLPDKDKKDKPGLIKDGGGFTGWVTRPVIKEILKK
jgi:hypothetical protein